MNSRKMTFSNQCDPEAYWSSKVTHMKRNISCFDLVLYVFYGSIKSAESTVYLYTS